MVALKPAISAAPGKTAQIETRGDMRHNLPFAMRGQKIGLLGGSFDPGHSGHLHITKQALRRFGLDQVWWLVSPGNPLKKHGPAPIAERMARAKALIVDPRVRVSDLEMRLQTRFTAETLDQLLPLYPGVHFVWLMGADNLVQFHRWERWRDIAERLPLGVLGRPGQMVHAGLSRSARHYAPARLRMRDAKALPTMKAPAWCLIAGPMVKMSSSEIRKKGDWNRAGNP